MNEQNWLTATDPTPMLEFLRGKASVRKLRLFSVACCRRVWMLLHLEGQAAVNVTDQFSEGLASKREVDTARRSAYMAAVADVALWYGAVPASLDVDTVATWHPAVAVAHPKASSPHRFAWVAFYASDLAERATHRGAAGTVCPPATGQSGSQERQAQANAVRCIFGNPFRPVTLDPSWLTPTVTSLAQAVYDDREMPSGLFDNHRMGVLADALEEAGCHNADMLGHLRGGGEHVRGCWAVDLVLGKE